MNINKISSMSFCASTRIFFNKYNTCSCQEVDGEEDVFVDYTQKYKSDEDKAAIISSVMASVPTEKIENIEVLSINKKGDLSLFKIDRDAENSYRFHMEEMSPDGVMYSKSQVCVKPDLYKTSDLAFQNAIDTYINLINPKNVAGFYITHNA